MDSKREFRGASQPSKQIPSVERRPSIAASKRIDLNRQDLNDNRGYSSNEIVTSKYTVLNFLPKFLFESFHKLANVYFLFICVLQSIPAISNTAGYPTNAPVLMFILMIDGILQLAEDGRRHEADRLANSAICHVLNPSTSLFEDKKWAELRVGNVIELKKGEVAPADLLILSVPSATSSIAYIETKNLDGETNLKLRQAFELTRHLQEGSDFTEDEFQGYMDMELPNAILNRFEGSLFLADASMAPSGHKNSTISVSSNSSRLRKPIGVDNLVLRGCELRNTARIYALVLNTGVDTKIMHTLISTPTKWSQLHQVINQLIVMLFAFMCLACGIASTIRLVWHDKYAHTKPYLEWDDKSVIQQWIYGFCFYILLIYQTIPVALYVTWSTITFGQSYFMAQDLDMYHEESDTRACVRTMGLNEELGQISHVLTDKTGTLTCNKMEFCKASIHGNSYGNTITVRTQTLESIARTNAAEGKSSRMSLACSSGSLLSPRPEDEEAAVKMPAPKIHPNVNFDDRELEMIVQDPKHIHHEHARDFFLHLAICHSIIPEKQANGEIEYSASSPDELALVAGASHFGFRFIERNSNGKIKIECTKLDEILDYEIKCMFEFSSERKRMSIIVEGSRGLYILTKGADSVIFPLLKPGCRIQKSTEMHLQTFAEEGLRTLTIAYRKLEQEEYEKWETEYVEAISSMKEIEKRRQGSDNKIDRLICEMEQNLDLLGATAIEDKLQDQVPETIAKLQDADIKVWMLTGDKEETAINIAFSCLLLNDRMRLLHLTGSHCANAEQIQSKIEQSRSSMLCSSNSTPILIYALIVDGIILDTILDSPELTNMFVRVATLCQTVICCRISPSQKAKMVCALREVDTKARVLSIGDGANDVPMIQKANIGVGISGQEGLQAVNSSDYAIAQFRFLQKLLLHHGRLNYARLVHVVGYMFYKNILLVLVQYFYSMFIAAASGQNYYNELAFNFFNIFYTSMPILYLGTIDEDVPADISITFPAMYRAGNSPESSLTGKLCLKWLAIALYEAVIIFGCVIYGGRVELPSLAEFGMIAFTLVVVTVNLKLFVLQYSWSLLSFLMWALGVISWLPLSIILSSKLLLYFPHDFGIFENSVSTWEFWLIFPIAIAATVGREFVVHAAYRMLRPSYNQIIQEDYILTKSGQPNAIIYPINTKVFADQASGEKLSPKKTGTFGTMAK